MGSSGGNAVAGASSVDSSAITDGSVANADLANMANKTFKGRHTAGTGVPEDVSAANLKSDLAIAASDVSGFDTQVRTSRVDQMAAPGADVPFATHKITGLGDPTSAQDAASKSYVDGLINGLSPKASCRLATAAALPTNAYVAGVLTATAFGALTVDGSVVAVGNRVLVKDEVAQANNGIYVVTATGGGAAFYILTRSTDMNTGAEVPGAYTLIEEGTANADSAWVVSGAGPYTIGVTAIPWVEFGGVFVSDTAYDATTWSGVTTIAPSKNAVRDKIESLSGASGPRIVVCPAVNFDTNRWAVTAVDDGAQTFGIAGDHTALLPDGSTFDLFGSTGNDGTYTVVSTAFAAGTTTITVVQAVTDPTADGTITNLSNYGVPIYTPTPGEWLLNVWPSVVTAFDGTMNHADVALDAGWVNDTDGFYAASSVGDLTLGLDLTAADVTDGSWFAVLDGMSAPGSNGVPALAERTTVANGVWRPPRFVSADPLICVVSALAKRQSDTHDGTHGSLVLRLLIGTDS